MKRIITLLLIAAAALGVGWTAYEFSAPAQPPLSRYAPAGALLYLQAKDFSALLADWNASPEKQQWLKSDNYEVFSRSRLFLRLRGASEQFAAAAGLPPDMDFLKQVAGAQSALALYDIGKLQFLYITRLPSAHSTETTLWQTRSKFDTRNAGGATFYLRRDPESQREVEFATSGDYLLLATREDLMAGALQLMAGSKDLTIESEAWWSQSVAAAGAEGDLRLVLNLEKIVPSPYFRSYWVQRNITDSKQYSSAISDLFRASGAYREERVLLRKAPSKAPPQGDGSEAVDGLLRLVPENAGFYAAEADPPADACFDVISTKLLAPHIGPAPPSQVAPQVELTSGVTGTSSDLETRIDEAPAQHGAGPQGTSRLKTLLTENPARAALRVQATERDRDGVFVRIHTAIALAGSKPWDEAAVRGALADFVGPDLTTGQLGLAWQAKNGYQELDGLRTLLEAAPGRMLIVADDPALMNSMLALRGRTPNGKPDSKPAVFAAGFDHQRERENFARLFSVVDRPNLNPTPAPGAEREPQFFSENLASLSSTLAAATSENIIVRDSGDKVLETVVYKWSR